MGNQVKPSIWRIRKGLDRRFRSGHPWVYSNELQDSPKGHTAGGLVQLLDPTGNFLAYGFGNPHSLIAFRTLTRNPEDTAPLSRESLLRKLRRASDLRKRCGFIGTSHRLCFGEADEIPGLVIDRYFGRSGQVFVIQAHTAGVDLILDNILSVIETLVLEESGKTAWDTTSLIIRNDLGVRKWEGLEESEARVARSITGVDLTQEEILVRSISDSAPLRFRVNLGTGQKTGFFLDQFANIRTAAETFAHFQPKGPIRILDLFSYVGQWGVQLGTFFQYKGIDVQVTAVDASAAALELARTNLEIAKVPCATLKRDILKDLGGLEKAQFDLVIADPPALIKSRKDIPIGTKAYQKLMGESLQFVREGGGFVACSCSALMTEESWSEVLAKGSQRSGPVRWVARGTPSPDHPMLAQFPEGRYLKAWFGIVR